MNPNLFFILLSVFLLWCAHMIQKRTGERQAREWKEYVASRPDLFKQPKDEHEEAK